VPLSAQTKEFPETSGNAFARLCSSIEKDTRTESEIGHMRSCVGYVRGFTDGIEFGSSYVEDKVNKQVPHLFCEPDGAENGQIIRIILKYIRDNPTEAHLPTSLLIVDALKKAFPCSTK
jgi:hypothetical protein